MSNGFHTDGVNECRGRIKLIVHRGRHTETARMAGLHNTGTVINEFHELTAGAYYNGRVGYGGFTAEIRGKPPS